VFSRVRSIKKNIIVAHIKTIGNRVQIISIGRVLINVVFANGLTLMRRAKTTIRPSTIISDKLTIQKATSYTCQVGIIKMKRRTNKISQLTVNASNSAYVVVRHRKIF